MEKYRRIYKDLYYRIKSGEIPPGTRLPPEAELASRLGVSKITVNAALKLLVADGLVMRKKRLGTIVLHGVVNSRGKSLVAIVFSGFDHLDIRLVNGLKQIATEKNVRLAFFDSETKPEKEREILGFLLTENVAGLILMPTSPGNNLDLVSMFSAQRVPLVYMDFPSYAAQAPTVTSDNRRGMYDLVRYLVRSGHRNVAFFPYSERFYPTVEKRFTGYCMALTESGVPVSEDFLFRTEKDTYAMMAEILKGDYSCADEFFERFSRLVPRPTAVVCANDILAYALISRAAAHGVKIPDELSVTGFDNLASAAKHEITTVAQDFAEISKSALRCLLRLIEGQYIEPTSINIHTVLIKRETVKPIDSGTFE